MGNRWTHEAEYRFILCRCVECVKDERERIGSAASFALRSAFSSTCKNTENMEIRHYMGMGKWDVRPMGGHRDEILRRGLVNKAMTQAVSERAVATAVELAAEGGSANSAVAASDSPIICILKVHCRLRSGGLLLDVS